MGGLDLEVLFHHRRDARRRPRRRGVGAASDGAGMDCWIVMARGNYKILAARSYRFAAALRVFHALRSASGIDRPVGCSHRRRPRARSARCDRKPSIDLPARRAPKTRRQFRAVQALRKRGIQGEIRCVMCLFAMPCGPRSAASAARWPRCAPTISPPAPIKALMARHPELDWSAGRRGLFRLRQPGRRGQPQRGADGAAAGGPAGVGSRPDAEPAVRLGAGRGRRRGRARSAPARSISPLPAASNR